MTTRALTPTAEPLRVAIPLARAAWWLEVYSQAAVRIATVGALISALIALLAIVVGVFTRQVLGFSLFGAAELASFAYLWTIWMGVSLAVKRGAVTVITLLSGRGPGLVARVGAGLLGDQPGDLPRLRLLAHHPVRARAGLAGAASPRRSRSPGSTRWSR